MSRKSKLTSSRRQSKIHQLFITWPIQTVVGTPSNPLVWIGPASTNGWTGILPLFAYPLRMERPRIDHLLLPCLVAALLQPPTSGQQSTPNSTTPNSQTNSQLL